jgi:hypothetical protein
VVGRFYPEAEAGVSMTQSAFSDNWAGGDKGSVVWTAIFNGSLENQLHEKVNWNNILKLAYGQAHQQTRDDDGELAWQAPEKTTDLVDFETLFRFTLGGFVDPYASGRFESQFQDASDPSGRELSLNPLRFRESAGIARKFIDEEDRSLLGRLGFALRQSSRLIFEEEPPSEETVREGAVDGGIEWITDYSAQVLDERVSWTSRLSFYKPLFYSGNDEFESLTAQQFTDAGIDPDIADYTTTLGVDFENIFTSQITKIISVGLYLRWVYDKYDNSVFPALTDDGNLKDPVTVRNAVRKAGQFKQTLSLGLTSRFL